MRRNSFMLVLVFLPVIASAQLTEIKSDAPDWILYGQVKYVGPAKASLQFIPHGADSTFLLLLWDQRPELKNYFSVRFSSRGNAVEALYEALMSFFGKENKKGKPAIRRFQLGSESISIYSSPTIGVRAITLSTDKGRIELTRGEIIRLFGKK